MILGLAAASVSGVSKMNCRSLVRTLTYWSCTPLPLSQTRPSSSSPKATSQPPNPLRLWLTAGAHTGHLLTGFPPGWAGGSVMKMAEALPGRSCRAVSLQLVSGHFSRFSRNVGPALNGQCRGLGPPSPDGLLMEELTTSTGPHHHHPAALGSRPGRGAQPWTG